MGHKGFSIRNLGGRSEALYDALLPDEKLLRTHPATDCGPDADPKNPVEKTGFVISLRPRERSF